MISGWQRSIQDRYLLESSHLGNLRRGIKWGSGAMSPGQRKTMVGIHTSIRVLLLVALVVAASGSFLATTPVNAVSSTTKFSSCKAVWKKYPNGIAENRRAARDVIREGYHRPVINRALYRANYRRLDDDYSGVICPRITPAAFADLIRDSMEQDICRGMDVLGTPMNQRPSYCQR